MQLTVSGHHVEITPALRAYVTEKIERVHRHFEHMTSARVVLTVDGNEQKAEATVHAGRKDLHVDDTQHDMYAAIDGMIDKLDKRVRRYKGKLQDHDHDRIQAPEIGAGDSA